MLPGMIKLLGGYSAFFDGFVDKLLYMCIGFKLNFRIAQMDCQRIAKRRLKN
jgi:hypothetical protein